MAERCSMATYGQRGGNELPFDEDSPTAGKGFWKRLPRHGKMNFKHSWADVHKLALRISLSLGGRVVRSITR